MFTITFFTITHFGVLIREKRNAQQEHMKLITNFLIPAAFLLFLGPLDHLLIRNGLQFLPCTLLTALTVPQGKRLKVYSNLKQKVTKTPLEKKIEIGVLKEIVCKMGKVSKLPRWLKTFFSPFIAGWCEWRCTKCQAVALLIFFSCFVNGVHLTAQASISCEVYPRICMLRLFALY